MTQLDDRGQMVKAARMYFLDGRGQDDVARVLGTSRSKVSRMLAAARAQGIVEIRIQDPRGAGPDQMQGQRQAVLITPHRLQQRQVLGNQQVELPDLLDILFSCGSDASAPVHLPAARRRWYSSRSRFMVAGSTSA